MLRALVLTVLLILPAPVLALCGGTDLRTTLTHDENARLTDALAGRPFPEGNHWQATRDDELIHLIGTMHIGDPRFDSVMESLTPLVQTAGRVMLEMTDIEEAQLQDMLASSPDMIVLKDTSLPEILTEDEWTTLSATLSNIGVPPFVAAKFQPWYVAILMALPSCVGLDGSAETGLDSRIEETALAANVPTQALEAYDAAIGAFADIPLDRQLDILRSGLTAPDDSADVFTTLAATYFDEKHAETWAVPNILSTRYSTMSIEETETLSADFSERLLTVRNAAWIDVILDAATATEGTLVVAFGAAHLSGADGVLALLQAEGFTLERQPF